MIAVPDGFLLKPNHHSRNSDKKNTNYAKLSVIVGRKACQKVLYLIHALYTYWYSTYIYAHGGNLKIRQTYSQPRYIYIYICIYISALSCVYVVLTPNPKRVILVPRDPKAPQHASHTATHTHVR